METLFRNLGRPNTKDAETRFLAKAVRHDRFLMRHTFVLLPDFAVRLVF